jgi:hypothetical protein
MRQEQVAAPRDGIKIWSRVKVKTLAIDQPDFQLRLAFIDYLRGQTDYQRVAFQIVFQTVGKSAQFRAAPQHLIPLPKLFESKIPRWL